MLSQNIIAYLFLPLRFLKVGIILLTTTLAPFLYIKGLNKCWQVNTLIVFLLGSMNNLIVMK